MRLLSCCCSCYTLLLVTGVFYNCASAASALEQLPPKCCPQDQVLVYEENGTTFACSSEAITDRILLHPPFHMDYFSVYFPRLRHNFPKCSEGETLISIRAEQGNKISCLDKVVLMNGEERNVGLLCVENRENVGDDELSEESFDVPDVFTLNKCCPLERSYSGYVNGCWDQRVPDNKTYLQGLVVAVLNDSLGYIDLKIGAPTCKSNEVLYDFFVPYKFVFQLDSDAVKLRIPGREGYYVILPPESVCVDFVGEDQLNLVVRACQDRTVLCQIEGKTCINKCCADGEKMMDDDFCGDVSRYDRFDPIIYDVETIENSEPTQVRVNPAITYGIKCSKYLLTPDKEGYLDDKHYLTTRGNLYFPSDSSFIDFYCTDVVTSMQKGNVTVMGTFVCFGDGNSNYASKLPIRDILYFVYGFGMIISCFSLFLTLLVYMCLPSLRNVHGKTIMCYIASLLVAYLCLISSQIGSVLGILSDNLRCKIAGYATLFAFLASFSWLNVLCFDIWYTFGTVRSSFIRSHSTSNRFLLYNVYCWGYSSAVIMAAVGTDLAAYRGIISHKYVSDVGVSRCWISAHTNGLYVFFGGPIGVQLFSNIILFILTISHCFKVKAELAKMQYNTTVKMRYNHDKKKLVMTLKLFTVMGIGWTLEILSQFLKPLHQMWFPSDVFNILQGVLIFVIFTMKEKVIRGVKSKMADILPGIFVKPDKTRPSTLTSSVFTTSSSECKMSVNTK
ncbi:probable G-protein coupled receptor Mth-like 2 [Nilaparvata lugens]|uniref:probable G-protein coupled receptor Mth-like 2 n=1 Tax=Nilaparvata lugens TaxID=108931 RepID=UPI00193D359C|nr:probable G-protein coupled receptor Mth-like 2 [Nilaparvata lugens]